MMLARYGSRQLAVTGCPDTQISAPREIARWTWIILAAVLAPHTAGALTFAPTESEWNTWPAYCQARYTVSGAGVDSQFSNRVDPAVVKSWEAKLGPDVWYSLHHYCASLIIGNRARATGDKRERELLLTRVIEEDRFSLARIPETHPMHAEVGAHKGLAHIDLGETDVGVQHLDMAIRNCPTCPIGYQAKAMFYRASGQLPEARRVLEEGDQALGGQSAVIHYFLGLVLLDLKEFAAAQEHARQAYELGYPLPGLRQRLARAGYPLK